jgi:hypothetical protein
MPLTGGSFLQRSRSQGQPQGAASADLSLDGGESGGKMSLAVNRSEFDHGQTGDSLEIAEV